MEWILLVIGSLVGIGGNLLASYLWEKVDKRRSSRKHGKLNIEGKWAEYIPDAAGRQFSLATIEYRRDRKLYVLNGTNYKNNGDPFCHWRTVASYLDLDNHVYHYVFATTDVGSLNVSSYGYGVLNLVRHEKSIEPQDGYYVYVDATGQAISVSHNFKRIHTMPASRTDNAAPIIDLAFPGQRAPALS